jgi:3-(3-hydroxy-phenyl)propionate hydroxylase
MPGQRCPDASHHRRRRIVADGLAQCLECFLQIGILYRVDGEPPQLPTGCLGPQGIVRSQRGQGRFDEIVGGGFQLIGWQVDPANYLSVGQLEFLHSIGAVACGVTYRGTDSEFLFDIDGAYKDFCRDFGVCGMIQRPDFIIFGTTQNPKEFSSLVNELRRQLRYDI